MTAFKLMLLGEIGVGKSSIARRLVFDRFESEYKPTIGVDVLRCELPAQPGLPPVTLIIWDTDGNFGDAIFQHVYLRQADGALIISDSSRRATLEAQRSLAKGFLNERPGRYCSLIVNKCDLAGAAEAKALDADLGDLNLPLALTSAKTGSNVAHVFQDAARTMARRNL